ncbi:glycine--tRNA ligase subunit beta [Fodinicurvata fenggangensis]|uniref:glycine--tRNA ligase subunit beta n=1 Tax=Fodinicurvata fenggangensis TaxID=1121830 RepID=UPI00047DD06B|nr:glycine--tRNA ligase subunit beta [Fodinicurvata fenggangensis]
MPELLLELFGEEIPARMQSRARQDMQRLLEEKLKEAGLEHEGIECFVTPRRLAAVVRGLPERQPDVTEERKGPKVGAPDKAVEGFMKANGLEDISQAEVRQTPKGDFYFAVRHIEGRATRTVLPDTISAVLLAMSWPKSMRWASGQGRWVRPLHRIVAIFDREPLGDAIQLTDWGFDVSHCSVVGHRFLNPDPFAVSSFEEYQDKLRQAYVILDQEERRRMIVEQSAALAHSAGLAVRPDPGLIDEVAGLVEWPETLMVPIPQDLMELPSEVLITAMRSHQKYLALVKPDGSLADRFLLVANMAAPEGSRIRDNIISGNARVLRARLDDARFFWEQDRKDSLESRVEALSDMVFHARLGSLADKVGRIEALAVGLAHRMTDVDIDRVRSAARLCKADLTTEMVGEFPELQGIMGRYYAAYDGEHVEVAQAIAEHYSPLGPNDACPSSGVSVALALADKIDTLVGFWAIDEKPTGSKDPYALRRAALGVIRLIVENGLRMPLLEVFRDAAGTYKGLEAEQVDVSLLEFLADRLKVTLRDRGVRHDLISAVFAVGDEDDLVRLLARVEALEAFLQSEDGANLLIAWRRAANIVRIESKKDARVFEGKVTQSRLEEEAEAQLYKALEKASADARTALGREDFAEAMAAMAALRRPVDAFFDSVTVNTEDSGLRENRLNLLARIGQTLSEVADFSKIEG